MPSPMIEVKDTAIDKALRVLEVLNGDGDGRSLASIAAETGLPKTTVHRLLSILTQRGFADRVHGGDYVVGRKIISLGLAAAEKDSLVNAAKPVLRHLVALTQETVQLGVLHDMQLLYVDRMEPADSSIRLARMPALMAELHTSAMGKAILAHSREEMIEAFLKMPLQRYTKHTITDAAKLREELEEIRLLGVAMVDQDRYLGVKALGSPLLDNDGFAFAAISVAGPAHRMDAITCGRIAEVLPEAARELSMLASMLH